MSIKKVEIMYGQVDPTAKADANFTTTSLMDWITNTTLTRDLSDESWINETYMTPEHNHNILDGSMSEFPSNPSLPTYKWGYFSKNMSNQNGIFTGTTPSITIKFSKPHKSIGLTLYSYINSSLYLNDIDYISKVKVSWYGAGRVLIHTGTYDLKSEVGIIEESIEDYTEIEINFLETSVPYRYVKLYRIDFGITRIFNDDEIDSVKTLERQEAISDIMPIGTLDFSIRTHNNIFSPVSDDSSDNMLMGKQQMKLYVDNTLWGVYFLDEWRDTLNTGLVFDFKAQDILGVLDIYEFKGGMYTNTLMNTLINTIFELCFPTKDITYELSSSLTNATVTGWIPKCTCREALQQICFANNAVVLVSRTGKLIITTLNTSDIPYNIDFNKLYLGGQISPTTFFSGARITSYEYIQSSTAETETIQEIENMPIGQHTINFSNPYHSIVVTGATIIEKNVNFVIINVTTVGKVLITGKKYVENILTFETKRTLRAGEIENICNFDNCTLITKSIAQNVVNYAFNYLSNRLSYSNDTLIDKSIVGTENNYLNILDAVKIETYKRPILGRIEELDTNLRSNRTKMKVVGKLGVD